MRVFEFLFIKCFYLITELKHASAVARHTSPDQTFGRGQSFDMTRPVKGDETEAGVFSAGFPDESARAFGERLSRFHERADR